VCCQIGLQVNDGRCCESRYLSICHNGGVSVRGRIIATEATYGMDYQLTGVGIYQDVSVEFQLAKQNQIIL
jgi:hypothetical protein